MQPICSVLCTILFMAVSNLSFSQPNHQEPMQGVPPSRESQVTMANYRDYPASRWAFRNAGAPMHAVMIPRGGNVRQFAAASRPELLSLKL